MAAGLPVVASDVGDLAQVLDRGRLGATVVPDDPGAGRGLCGSGPRSRGGTAMGARARAEVLAHHGWDRIVSRIIARAGAAGQEAA